MNQNLSFAAQVLRSLRSYFFLLTVLLLLFPALAARAQDNAAFVSQNVPTSMVAGQQYSVSVTMQNNGSSTWTDGNSYHLGSANPQDNTTWHAPLNGNRVAQPLNVPPGGKVTYAFLITAPQAAGTYNFQWRMLHEGIAWFGTTSSNVSINVTADPNQTVNPQIPQGGSTAFGATNSGGADAYKGSWTIYGSSSGVNVSDAAPQGYSVSCNVSGLLTVGVPSTAPKAVNYSVHYTTRVQTVDTGRGGTELIGVGFGGSFDIIAPPVTAPPPAATGPAYPWQASVGGVNTANGNKFVSVPLVGWMGRGGMPIGVSLDWNSQAVTDGYMTHCGNKWHCNYDARIQSNIDGNGGVGVFWGDGRSYRFVHNADNSYTPPAGIYDTLTSPNSGQFLLKTKGQTTYTFNLYTAPNYYLVTIADENGNAISINRWGDTRLQNVTEYQTGRAIQFGYDTSVSPPRLNSVTDPLGRLWYMEYDSGGSLSRVHWPSLNGADRFVHMAYDQNPNMIEFDDLNGHAAWGAAYLSSPYCALGTEWDAYSNSTSFTYTGGTKVTNANNNVTTYVYTGGAIGTLQSVTDPLTYADILFYDSSNNLKQHTDRRGKIWKYGLDSKHGNATSAIDPVGNSSSSLYDARNSKTLQTMDALDHSTTFVYDNSGINLLSTTDALGHTSTINSYQYGLPTSVSDALGHTSSMTYDGFGNLTRATDALGHSSTATYNLLGWKMTSTDALGQTSGYRYDAWGRVRAVNALPAMGLPFYKLVSSDGAHSFETSNQGEYNSAVGGGWVPQPPVGGVFQNSTDMPGLVPLYKMRENPQGDRFYTTDANLRSTAITQWGYADEGIAGYVMAAPAAGFKPFYCAYNPGVRDYYTDDADEYNSLPSPWVKNGILCYVYNNTVRTTYDYNGNVLTVTDQNNHTTTNTYDNDNRLLSTAKANNDQIVFGYDANGYQGLLSSKTDGNGNAYLYRYTARNELSEMDYPDGTKENYYYDENGNLKNFIKRDRILISYGYDNDSRQTNTYYPSGGITQNVTLGYDAAGRQQTMADVTGTTSWTYDAANRLTQMQAPGSTVSYGYDDANRRTGMTQGGHTTSYFYDNGGRMTTLDNGLGNVFDFTYDNDNRLKIRNNRQAVGTAYTYTSAGLVTQVLSNQNQGSGGTLNTDNYTYDPAGNRATSASYDGYTAYSYDAADQLTGENHNTGYPSFTASYDYDHNGNRLHKTQNGQTDTYHYQANAYNSSLHTDELQSVTGGILGSKTFGYDANGVARTMTTNGQTLYLTADAEDRYTRVDFNTGPGQGSAYSTASYNGAGLRVFHHDVWGHDFPQAYDGASPGAALLSSAGTLFTPGLMQQDNGSQHFYQTDALGSVRGTSDNAQSPLSEVYFDAFGLPSLRQGSLPSPLGFAGAAGYQTDTDTGLMLLGNRYYDPTIGRFLSPDPSGSGDNWYAYCDNDPTGEIDPEGLLGVATPTSHEDQFSRYSQAIEADGGNSKTYEVDAVFRYAGGSHAGQEVPGTRYEEYEYTVYFGEGDFQLANYDDDPAAYRNSFLGRNVKGDKSDLPGGRAVAKSIFRHLTRGLKITQDKTKLEGIRRFPKAPNVNRPQIRMEENGKTNIDMQSGEDIHFPLSPTQRLNDFGRPVNDPFLDGEVMLDGLEE